MADVQALRKLLREEYGIRSDRELSQAISRMDKIDIGVFTSPVERRRHNGSKKECIA